MEIKDTLIVLSYYYISWFYKERIQTQCFIQCFVSILKFKLDTR